MPKGVYQRSRVCRQDARRVCDCGGRFQDAGVLLITRGWLSPVVQGSDDVPLSVQQSEAARVTVWRCNRCAAERADD